jgi:hypothetical protein
MKSRYDAIILGAGRPLSVAAATFGAASKGIVNS